MFSGMRIAFLVVRSVRNVVSNLVLISIVYDETKMMK